MDPRRTAETLKQWALEAGFDRAGLAQLGPSRDEAPFLAWLERGDQAGMDYLERRVELRLDPRRIFPGARSVLCVALSYHPLTGEPEPEGDLWPRVARYARGDGYHKLMGDRLQGLVRRVEEAFPGSSCRVYVDTGAILERELAARAGLGAVGKNTNLLHPEAGSWFLLGELILSLEVCPERPIADLCGSCSACLEACPTGALPEPYRLDSNRCISYWTIEHRGEIPRHVRPWLGDWVFGCDVCQEACPANEGLQPADHDQLRLPAARGDLDMEGLLLMGRQEYVERFRGSPMKRAKLEGLQRNAAVAMGNRREAGYLPALALALEQGSLEVRRHAAWAIGRIGGIEAERILRSAALREADPLVVQEIRHGLSGEDGRPAADSG